MRKTFYSAAYAASFRGMQGANSPRRKYGLRSYLCVTSKYNIKKRYAFYVAKQTYFSGKITNIQFNKRVEKNVSRPTQPHAAMQPYRRESRRVLKKAIEQGISIFGFSDHAPMDFDSEYRMGFHQMESYEKEILGAKRESLKTASTCKTRIRSRLSAGFYRRKSA